MKMSNPLTLDDMSVELDAKYEKICKKNNYCPENEDDKKGRRRNNNHGAALVASGNGVFKGRCNVCRKWRHKSNQYPFRNNRNTHNGLNTQKKHAKYKQSYEYISKRKSYEQFSDEKYEQVKISRKVQSLWKVEI